MMPVGKITWKEGEVTDLVNSLSVTYTAEVQEAIFDKSQSCRVSQG